MNLRDIIIIYLASGAPFGVYYFLQNRNFLEIKLLLIKSLLRFIFWIPFAFQLVARKSFFTNFFKKVFDRTSISDAHIEFEIERIKKLSENLLLESKFQLSIYEFREVFERYVGLTLEIQIENSEIEQSEKEIFRITNHTNKKLAEKCLNRRNRKRLAIHQKLARRDFFEVFEQIVNHSEEPQTLMVEANNLFRLLPDLEAQANLEMITKDSLQTPKRSIVNRLEKGLWNSEKQKLSPANQISSNMQIMTANVNLSKKD